MALFDRAKKKTKKKKILGLRDTSVGAKIKKVLDIGKSKKKKTKIVASDDVPKTGKSATRAGVEKVLKKKLVKKKGSRG